VAEGDYTGDISHFSVLIQGAVCSEEWLHALAEFERLEDPSSESANKDHISDLLEQSD
jgi:hypothetical protein